MLLEGLLKTKDCSAPELREKKQTIFMKRLIWKVSHIKMNVTLHHSPDYNCSQIKSIAEIINNEQVLHLIISLNSQSNTSYVKRQVYVKSRQLQFMIFSN